jgi:hypothetical protein
MSRIYTIVAKATGERTLVRANTRITALSHVAELNNSVRVSTQDDLIGVAAGNILDATVSADPRQLPLLSPYSTGPIADDLGNIIAAAGMGC